ncbi:hypothetical protein QAD02_014181 [Eretmocerus hayati]|uniref:Uncharacterized protein n=3 Tax=Eretmocerus hayati TaxID=131215 RepID=A0ACC2NSY3_9HYME|nr:hypothetical protein QAD02_004768 [Eretmocerus hayati]KAJ8674227.1 hypothetical protein QAD02_005489 [Eretmocerus hayati]KAJ8678394.1 hypothetical protein QAD02_014181 [Eretmocerus hayati]
MGDIRRRFICFVCGAALGRQNMPFVGENIEKREIAIVRRDANGRAPMEIVEETRLCGNCNRSILNEIRMLQDDPSSLRLNVLSQTSSQTCLVCDGDNNIVRLSTQARVNIYLKRDIYASENTRSCQDHLDDVGQLFSEHLENLRSVNRPLKIAGTVLRPFLEELRNNCTTSMKYENENNFTEEEFATLSPITREQFRVLFTYCDPVVEQNQFLYVTKRHLLTFLCKMRQGVPDDFLATTFRYNTRQRVSSVIATVRRSLMQRFVPEHLGLDHITRGEFVDRHVNDFANNLYNPTPQRRRIIIYIDGTYIEVEMSGNFSAARKSYSSHKHYYLLKPTVIVGPDGYILDVLPIYFSDVRNNDANIIVDTLQRHDAHDLRRFLQPGDIVILDRGYEHARGFLEQAGIIVLVPPFLEPNQRQFTTEQANYSRLITKTRWIVEARNGHFKSMFKFFDHRVSAVHAINLEDFFKIAAALINAFRPTITMAGVDGQYANELRARAEMPNVMQARIEVDNYLRTRNGQWRRLNEFDDADFPNLTEANLQDITAGVYQINLSPAYIQDKLLRDENEVFEFDALINEPGLIRVRIWSRFRNAVKHQLWVAYGYDEDQDILAYYCTCMAGARTLGSCAHVASVLWFLGHARHQDVVKYPSVAMIQNINYARRN